MTENVRGVKTEGLELLVEPRIPADAVGDTQGDSPVPPVPPVPEGALLLHIGVPKTGTTAIQNAFGTLAQQSPGRLAELGMRMPGTPLQQARGALSAVGSLVGYGGAGRKPYGAHHWQGLLDQLAENGPARPGALRQFVSSEYFCEARPKQVKQVVADLAGYDPHVVVTLRPLARILPSAWQQYLKSGHQLPYEEWLHAVLDDPPRKDVTPSFWRRHDHGAVVSRWAGAVGADRTVVMVLDPTDRELIYRSFAHLMALPDGLLREGGATREGLENRSMTAAESELFRQINVVLRSSAMPWDDYAHLVRYGAIARAVRNGTPPDAETALRTPQWALDRAAELGGRYVEAIRASGARVIGDLELLAAPPAPARPAVDVETVPVTVAVEALLGAVARSTRGESWFETEQVEPSETDGLGAGAADGEGDASRTEVRTHGRAVRDSTPIGRLTTGELLTVVRARVARGVRRRYLKAKFTARRRGR
ncbi:hypothetical protein ACIB24_17865 [Spongisporangium articulatum]|uniref:Sulfotransferase family protein n=1 Tax=Spongisporangium articulatum TaxID=3362603 RepID=A0ABW8ARB8_9ACTN